MSRPDTRVLVEVRTMNRGRDDEFERVFFTCHMGHDLGSVPLDFLRDPDRTRMDMTCGHYGHGGERV